jgi:hypothetical protein
MTVLEQQVIHANGRTIARKSTLNICRKCGSVFLDVPQDLTNHHSVCGSGQRSLFATFAANDGLRRRKSYVHGSGVCERIASAAKLHRQAAALLDELLPETAV